MLDSSGSPLSATPVNLLITGIADFISKTRSSFDTFLFTVKIKHSTGADPGFPVGGGANSWGGAPTYKLAGFSQKLHEIKKILVRKGRGQYQRNKTRGTILMIFWGDRRCLKIDVFTVFRFALCLPGESDISASQTHNLVFPKLLKLALLPFLCNLK